MSVLHTSLRRQLAEMPIISLVHPREYTPHVLAAVVAGIALGTAAVRWLGYPLWTAVAIFLAVLLIPGTLKWRADKRRFGLVVMGISFLLAAQGFHTIEHIAQWIQYHVLNWSQRASVGLLSPANSEWVHFVWNWLVVIAVATLIWRGMRNPWAYLLLAWACAHTFEHTYMFVRYHMVLSELARLGITNITAQGLPGILGQDGWLARSELTQGTFFCRLPGLTTAPRLDVHFWWNMGEVGLLLLAAHTYLRNTRALTAEANKKPVT